MKVEPPPPSPTEVAADLFTRAAKIVPDEPEPFIILGVLCVIKSDYEAGQSDKFFFVENQFSKEFNVFFSAIRHMKSALENDPSDYTLWNKLGATLANCGNAQEALYAYQHAVDLRPKYIRGHVNLGMAYQNQSRCEPFNLLLGPVRLI